MGRFVLLVCILARVTTISPAQTITETFGTGANAFTMDFVTIGNPNNAADTAGGRPNLVGSVAYTYNLGKYEVSRGQIDKANAAGSLGITMYDMSSYDGNGVNKPATGLSWYEAAKYVNWLNTSTGGTAAYKFDGNGNFQLWSPTDAGYNANNMFRNSLAKYVITSRDEWYKGAYGNLDGTWNDYPTGSNNSPDAVASGTTANTAVYNGQPGPADISNAGGLSAYGTMGQGGNVFEWYETELGGSNITDWYNREMGGGYWDSGIPIIEAWNRGAYASPWAESELIGFRIAMVPEPSSLSMLALGSLVVAVGIRRRS
jgi:formylglycine-generating enzyme required for sulfatase activity